MPRAGKQQLRNLILERRGLLKGKQGKLRIKPPLANPATPERKGVTYAMKLLEKEYGMPIEQLIDPKLGNNKVARRLGVDPATVSRWRYKLGLLKKE